MMFKKIFGFIFSMLFLLPGIYAQVEKPETREISLGVDLSRFLLPVVDSTRLGWEVSGDFELLKDMFVAAEFGYQNTKLERESYNYSGNGYYTRLGVDYNFMHHVDSTSTDQMLVGVRYGFTTFNHMADNIVVQDPYYGSLQGGSIPKNWLAANWLEVDLGMRVELLCNFYLGWSVRIKTRLWSTKDSNLEPYYIPGFGRNYSNTNIGFNYSLYYCLPIKKKSKSVIPE